MKYLVTSLLLLITIVTQAQTIKFKKEIAPLIASENYSVESKKLALRYHAENVDANGALKGKALLIGYKSMVSTRNYLGDAYYSIAVADGNIGFMDSSIYYFEFAQMMIDAPDKSSVIKAVKQSKKKLIAQVEDEEIAALHAKYEVKRDTLIFMGGTEETYGYSPKTEFQNSSGEALFFESANLKRYSIPDKKWLMIESIRDEKFLVEYKLVKIPGDEMNGTREVNKLLSIYPIDEQRVHQIIEDELEACKTELEAYVNELIIEFPEVNVKEMWEFNLVSSIDDCNYFRATFRESIEQSITETQDSAQEQAEKNKLFQEEQKTLRGSVSCTTCPESVAKKFIAAAMTFNESGMKTTMIAYNSATTEEQAQKLWAPYEPLSFRPFRLDEYIQRRDNREVRSLKSNSGKYYTYFSSKTIAVVVCPPSPESRKAYSIFLVLENGTWKVIDAEDSPYVPGDSISENAVPYIMEEAKKLY